MPGDAEFLALALEQARLARQMDEVPVGAVLVDDQGQVLASGHNRREVDQNPVSHAEIETLLAASRARQSWRLENCTLYVTLEPCPMCLAACQQARVARIVFGAADPKGGALSLGYRLHEDAHTNHRFVVEHVPTPECGQILTEYFSSKRRQKS